MPDTTQEQSLQEAIARFKNASGLADDYTRGDASVDVQGVSGSYPSLAKLAAQSQTKLRLLQAIPIVNTSNADLILGMAVYAPGPGLGAPANASSVTQKNVIGLVADDLILSQSGRGSVLSTGTLTGSREQWETTTGLAGGLIPDRTYYLDIAAGRITPYPSSEPGHHLCPVGYALTETELIIRIDRTIAL
jgi:hypothetical protein